jgi:hypothetical protein
VSASLYRCFKYWSWQTFIKVLKLPQSFTFLPFVLRIETALTVAIDLLICACHIVQSVQVTETQCWDFDLPSRVVTNQDETTRHDSVSVS